MRVWVTLGFLISVSAAASIPNLKTEKVFTADSKKNSHYIRDGLIVGGDQAIDDVVLLDIRRASNPGYERVVIDVEGNLNGEPAAIHRPPYYQMDVSPEMRRLVFTVWGKPKLVFNMQNIAKAFKKSKVVSSIQFLPLVEKDRWTFVLNLKADAPIEVFELNHPVRIIIDLKTASK